MSFTNIPEVMDQPTIKFRIVAANIQTVQNPVRNNFHKNVEKRDDAPVEFNRGDVNPPNQKIHFLQDGMPSVSPLPLNTVLDPAKSAMSSPDHSKNIKYDVCCQDSIEPGHLNSQSCDQSKGQTSTNVQTAGAHSHPPAAPPQYLQGQTFVANTQTPVANSYPSAAPPQTNQESNNLGLNMSFVGHYRRS